MESNSLIFLGAFVLCLIVYGKTLEAFSIVKMDTSADESEKIRQLQQELYECSLANQRLVQSVVNQRVSRVVQSDGPVRTYTNPYKEMYATYSQVGYITAQDYQNERYPLYGKHKFPGRSDKWLYYIVDEGRARIKVEVKRRNDEELSSGDVIQVFGKSFDVEIYPYDTVEYNPNVI